MFAATHPWVEGSCMDRFDFLPVQLTAEPNMKNGIKQLRRAHFSCVDEGTRMGASGDFSPRDRIYSKQLGALSCFFFGHAKKKRSLIHTTMKIDLN
jgi:hypothetical protein